MRLYWPWSRIKRLRKALDEATGLGVYPKSIVGEGGYDQRTEWMDGWNEHAIRSLAEVEKVLKRGDWEDGQ